MRAVEQARPPGRRLVDDPYAPWFLGPVLGHRLAARAARVPAPVSGLPFAALTTYIQVRHRFMDDALLAALGGVAQVVVLGAGYDMRAWRFAAALGGRTVWEVDHPATAARKLRRLQGRAAPDVDVRRVTVDFQHQRWEERLVAAGFPVGRPTFFVWEGVSMYLRRDAVAGTLRALAALGGEGSELVMDFWQHLDAPDLAASVHRLSAGLLTFLGEPVTFAIHPDDAGHLLGRLGWTVTDLADPAELARRYVRDGRVVYPANFVVRARRA